MAVIARAGKSISVGIVLIAILAIKFKLEIPHEKDDCDVAGSSA
jgi:hypothetical protein